MSSHAARFARRRPRASVRRRRLTLLAIAVALAAVAAGVVAGTEPLEDAVREITLPLRHEDIIRQQASDKRIDPALIAAVIYEESRFRDQTSHAGARGLMQITPDTADFIARRSGGVLFEQADLATPQSNETLAVAAYNAGQTNVDRWVERAGGPGEFDRARHVPFPETRAYVENVMERRGEYREKYSAELGL